MRIVTVLCLLVFLAGPVAVRAQMPPANVVVAPVEQRDLELTRPLVASVESVTSTILAAEESGLVKERSFDEGHIVEKGQVLVSQDVDLLKVQQQAAQAALKAAEAMTRQARAEVRNAENEVQRLATLFEREAVTEKEYRDAQTTLEVRQAAVAAREAEVLARQADLERIAIQLAKSQLRSPIRGVVQKRYVEVGQWLRQGDAVAHLVQLDPLYVRVNVPEGVVSQLRVGASAKVEIPALNDATFEATVDQVLPQADAATRTFAVKLLLQNPELAIRPGFFARVTLVAQNVAGAVVVPKNAVVTRGRESRVVVARENAAVLVPVKLGPADGTHVSVTPLEGTLEVGDQVVIRGNEALMPGQQLVLPQGPPGGAGPQGGAPPQGDADVEQGAGAGGAGGAGHGAPAGQDAPAQ